MSQDPFAFTGRIGAGAFAVSLGILVPSALCLGAFVNSVQDGDSVREAMVLCACIGWTYFGCVQAAKRARDAGWSGWWGLVMAIPFVQFLACFVFLAVRGDPAENRFGPVAGPELHRGVRVFLWGLLVVVILAVLAGVAFLMALSGALAHMNGR